MDIRRTSPHTACVVLSSQTDDLAFARAIYAGASATLQKSVNIAQLKHVVRTVAAGASYLPPEETSRRSRHWMRRSLDIGTLRRLRRSLTSRESEVLHLLAQGADNEHFGRQLLISPHTVQAHVRNLLAKLGAHPRLTR